jgi:hypothetical protein
MRTTTTTNTRAGWSYALENRVLYAMEPEMWPSRIQFVEWWLKTGFGLQPECRDTLHWDGKKTSASWKHFEQVANKRTSEPKTMCVTGLHGRSVIGPTQLGHWALDDRQNGSVERINERIDIEWIS